MKFNMAISPMGAGKVNKKLHLAFKSAFFIAAFIFLGNIIAAQSGITNQVSKIFYWGEEGTVAGEYTVRLAAAANPVLGISGDKFTISGTPTFLLGVSAFDAVGKIQDSDLDYFANNNYNLIRIWLYWRDKNISYDANGNLIPAKQAELINLIQRAASRGIIVDVTLLYLYDGIETPIDYPSFGTDINKMRNAVKSVATALNGYDNVLFDIMNEHNNTGNGDPAGQSHSTIQTLKADIKAIDPNRIVTVSSTQRHLINPGAETLVTSNIDEEVNLIGVDVLTPHLPRSDKTANWYDLTSSRVASLKNYLKNTLGKNIPVYLQEEDAYPDGGSTSNFVTAATNAKNAGVAGWIFHQRYGFDFGAGTFYNQAGSGGRLTLEEIGAAIGGGQSCTPGVSCTTGENCPGTYNNVCNCVDIAGDSCPAGGGGNACNSGAPVNDPLTSNPGRATVVVSGGTFSSDGWTTNNANSNIEYRFTQPFESGELEFNIKGLSDSKLTGEVYDLFGVWDESEIGHDMGTNSSEVYNNRYKSFLYIFGDIKGEGAYGPGTYTGKIRPRLKVNNTTHGVDGDLTGTATHDNFEGTFDFNSNTISADGATAAAYPWNVDEIYGFKIVWGSGKMTYSFKEPFGTYYPIGQYDYTLSNKQYNPPLPYLRLGKFDYGAVPGITYSNFKLTCGGAGGPTPYCGNGTKEAGEGCDDGNVISGDGCSAACQVEGGGGSCTSGSNCTTAQSCPGTCDSGRVCQDILGDSCPSGGGAGNKIKIADNARDPAIAIDKTGAAHIVYETNCYLKNGRPLSCDMMYVKYICQNQQGVIDESSRKKIGTGANARVAPDANNNIHIAWDHPGISGREGIKYNRIENDNPVWTEGRLLFANPPGVEKARIAVDNNEIYISFQNMPHVSFVHFDAAAFSPSTPAFPALFTTAQNIDQNPDSDSKGVRQGGIAIDNQNGVHFSWSHYPEGGYYRKYSSGTFYAVQRVTQGLGEQATSDFTSISVNKNNNEIVYVAQPGNVDNPSNLFYGHLWYQNLGTDVNNEKLSGYNFGTEVGLIDDGDHLNVEVAVDTRNISYVTFAGSNLKTQIEEEKDANGIPYSHTCGDNVCHWYYESFEQNVAGMEYCPNDCGHYAYYFTVDQSGVYSGEAAFRLTPSSINNNQGGKKTNPVPAPARNQGVYVVFEDNAENPNYNAYLISLDGADVCGQAQSLSLKADLNCDNKVDVYDLGILMSCWEAAFNYPVCASGANLAATCNKSPDLNGDLVVDVSDLGIMLSCWGTNNSAQCTTVI